MRIAQIKVYQFDELTEEAKEKALGKLRDTNVDYYWWELEYEHFKAELEKMGIVAEDFAFDIGRGDYLYITKGGILDEKKLLESAGVDLRTEEARDALTYGITLKTVYQGAGQGYNYFEPNDFKEVNICEWIREILRGFLKELRDTYYYLISDGAVVDTIEANEYEFTEEGELF